MRIEVHHGCQPEGEHVFLHVATFTMGVGYEEDEAALEFTWRYTNNVEGSWSQGPFVLDAPNTDYVPNRVIHVPLHIQNGITYGLRSSMVGDRFVVVEGDARRVYEVASFGFKRLA